MLGTVLYFGAALFMLCACLFPLFDGGER